MLSDGTSQPLIKNHREGLIARRDRNLELTGGRLGGGQNIEDGGVTTGGQNSGVSRQWPARE